MKSIRILLVDDHAIVREGYCALLAKQSDFLVVGEAADANQAYRQFQACAPDLVISDLSLPDSSALELIRRIRHSDASVKVLVFSMHQTAHYVVQAIQAGAHAYVSKNSEAEFLLQAIRDVMAGQRVLSPDIAQLLAAEKLYGSEQVLQQLSVREYEILRLLVEGLSHQQIAELLHISPKTVGNCHYQLKSKLGVDNDIALVRLALKGHMLDNVEK
jgi:two-component system, NarL family, invasion response regulator UvrY